jgi:hypothetical protein
MRSQAPRTVGDMDGNWDHDVFVPKP